MWQSHFSASIKRKRIKKIMRILLLHKTRKGGVGVYVRYVKKELEKEGHTVVEVTRNEDLNVDSFMKSIGTLRKRARLWKTEFDIIHANDWSIVFPLLLEGTENLVATFHAFPTNPAARVFQDYCIRKLKGRAIVISPSMKKKYKGATYIPNGVDLALFRRIKKRAKDSLKAGVAQSYNKERIREACIKSGFVFQDTEGKLPYSKLPDFFSGLEVFVSMPYKQAGFNMVWLEAMACEVPFIIGTKAGIGSELPIYKVRDFKELEAMLADIREGKLKELRKQRTWLKDNHMTWKETAKELIKLYKEVRAL